MKKTRLAAMTLALVSAIALSLVLAPAVLACCPCTEAWIACRDHGHSLEDCDAVFEACLDILYPL